MLDLSADPGFRSSLTGGVVELPEAYNAAVDLLERNLPDRRDHPAVVDRSGVHTYGELVERANRAGNLLRSLGARQEDRVALCLLDTVDFPALFCGAIKAGVVPVCLNTLLTTDTYATLLADCRARILVVSAELAGTLVPALEGLTHLEHVLVAGGGSHSLTTIDLDDGLAGASAELSPAPTHRDEIAFWLYSSGSTGTPKGVRHRHASPVQTASCYGQGVLGIGPDDVVFSAAKLYFAYGLGNSFTFPFSVGATTVLLDERPTPEAVVKLAAEHRPTIFSGVPTLYAGLLADPAVSGDALGGRLRRCVSAGEALPQAIGSEWERRVGTEILDGLGSTEMLHIFLSNRPGQVRYGWSGTPVPGYETKVLDEAGEPTPTGEVGELYVSGPSAAEGYWNRRERTEQTFLGPWTRTGDKYLVDASGWHQYCGRADDMFKSGGNWVSPFEVESALLEHPDVAEAAVIGSPDEAGNLKPKAYVVTRPRATADVAELQEHVKARIELWKYPRQITFVDELPKTTTGKVQRYKLRELDRAGGAGVPGGDRT